MHEWALADVVRNQAKVEALAACVITKAAELEEHRAAWAEGRANQKTMKLGASKRGSMQFRKDTAPYRASMPSKVLHWLTGKDFWVEEGRLRVQGEAVIASENDDIWDYGVPCLWLESDVGPQRWWNTLLVSWGRRVELQQSRLVSALAKRPDLKGKVMMQTHPQENRTESYLEEAWVPDHCRDSDCRPAGLLTYGAPWHLYENANTWMGRLCGLAHAWHRAGMVSRGRDAIAADVACVCLREQGLCRRGRLGLAVR